MTTVRFPAELRASVGGAREMAVAGATVGEVAATRTATQPALEDHRFTADGELNRFVNAHPSDRDVRWR